MPKIYVINRKKYYSLQWIYLQINNYCPWYIANTHDQLTNMYNNN